jgi:SOS response regulatory protein OraA/RecX
VVKTNQKRNSKLEESYSKVYGKILNFLSYRNRTQQEVVGRLEKYLSRESIPISEKKEIKERILEKLKEEGYTDDSKFLFEYIELAQKSGKPRSILFLKRDLYRKGVPLNLVDRYLGLLPDEYEYEAALLWGRKKISTLHIDDVSVLRQKLINYLKTRGFSLSSILKAVSTLIG